MTRQEANARAARWEHAIARFDEWDQVGVAEDGSPIRAGFGYGPSVREPSGFVCSPIAYSVRLATSRT